VGGGRRGLNPCPGIGTGGYDRGAETGSHPPGKHPMGATPLPHGPPSRRPPPWSTMRGPWRMYGLHRGRRISSMRPTGRSPCPAGASTPGGPPSTRCTCSLSSGEPPTTPPPPWSSTAAPAGRTTRGESRGCEGLALKGKAFCCVWAALVPGMRSSTARGVLHCCA